MGERLFHNDLLDTVRMLHEKGIEKVESNWKEDPKMSEAIEKLMKGSKEKGVKKD